MGLLLWDSFSMFFFYNEKFHGGSFLDNHHDFLCCAPRACPTGDWKNSTSRLHGIIHKTWRHLLNESWCQKKQDTILPRSFLLSISPSSLRLELPFENATMSEHSIQRCKIRLERPVAWRHDPCTDLADA